MNLHIKFGCSLAIAGALGGVGCGTDGDEVGREVACQIDELFPRISSDRDELLAAIDCEDGADCSNRREVVRGAQFDFVIELPEELLGAAHRVESSDPDRLELSGYETGASPCERGLELRGTARFAGAGEAAVIVYVDDEEVDRFTATAYEPSSLSLQAIEGLDWLTVDGTFQTVDELSIDAAYTVRATLRNDAGERLIGATGFEWSVADPDVVELSSEDAAWPLLTPRAIGSTTLSVRVAGFSAEIPVEVTAVPAEPEED